jgi:hypothetical protein
MNIPIQAVHIKLDATQIEALEAVLKLASRFMWPSWTKIGRQQRYELNEVAAILAKARRLANLEPSLPGKGH